MATWLKVSDGRHTEILVDLDKVIQFEHNTRERQVSIYLGNGSTLISERVMPVAYTKVLGYMRQIEEQTRKLNLNGKAEPLPSGIR